MKQSRTEQKRSAQCPVSQVSRSQSQRVWYRWDEQLVSLTEDSDSCWCEVTSDTLTLPACFHALIEGFVNLLLTRQGAPQLLAHLPSQVKGQGVTLLSLHQKYACIAAGSGIHCVNRDDSDVSKIRSTFSTFRFSDSFKQVFRSADVKSARQSLQNLIICYY